MTSYCANDPCEVEATHMIVETKTPLCYTCSTAYKWGQASPNKEVQDIEAYFSELTYVVKVDIDPEDIAEYNDISRLPEDMTISKGTRVEVEEWDAGDETALVIPSNYPQEEIWILQDWLEEKK